MPFAERRTAVSGECCGPEYNLLWGTLHPKCASSRFQHLSVHSGGDGREEGTYGVESSGEKARLDHGARTTRQTTEP